MLDLSRTRIEVSMEEKLASFTYADNGNTTNSAPEGSALMYTWEDNMNKVTLANNTSSTSLFAGVVLQAYSRPTVFNRVDVLQVGLLPDGNYGVVLTQQPNQTVSGSTVLVSKAQASSASLQAFNGDYGPSSTVYTFASGLTSATLTSASDWSYISATNEVVVESSLNGTLLYITYQYNLSVSEAQLLTGDGVPVTMPSQVTGTIGVIRRGLIYTSQFDPSTNWLTANTVYLGPGGIFTGTSGGATVPCIVKEVPTGLVPYLGLLIPAY